MQTKLVHLIQNYILHVFREIHKYVMSLPFFYQQEHQQIKDSHSRTQLCFAGRRYEGIWPEILRCHHKSSSCDQPYTLKLRTNARSPVMKKDGMAVVCGGSLPQLERKKFNKTWMMSHSRFMILDASPFLYRSWLMKKLLTRGCHLCKVQKGHEVFRHISSYYQKGSYKIVP